MLQAVFITITYTVRVGKREEFLSLMAGILDRINGQGGIQLSLYATDNNDNTFVEVYSCDTMDNYEALEDNLDEQTRADIARIASEFVTNRQTFTSMRRVL